MVFAHHFTQDFDLWEPLQAALYLVGANLGHGGLVLGHVDPMLTLYWAVLGLSWVYLGSILGLSWVYLGSFMLMSSQLK